MHPDEVERLIESELDGAEATVTYAREKHDENHLAATVVSETFADVPLVQQHQQVYDALDEHMTTDIHALELSTYTPEEFAEK
ncbi:BolA/IbaG family iron-sulfur metabolism protein [Halobacteria archaeon AArc-dxtr1]|nr:BolA/IbaG family iron-sulfur metabolism protein [Halobacteria archaeon AArc-dxtr1]